MGLAVRIVRVVIAVIIVMIGAKISTIPRVRVLVLPSMASPVNFVLQATRALQNVRVFWIIVTFAGHCDAAEPVIIVHVCFTLPVDVMAIKSTVVALH